MEDLFARGINSIANSRHHEFYLFQTDWYRQNPKVVARCAVLFTVLLIHFTCDLLLALLALMVLACAWLWLIALDSRKDGQSQSGGVPPPSAKKQKTEQQALKSEASFLAALEQKLMSASLMDDILSVLMSRACYTAISILLLVCFTPTPLFLVILTAFSYASLTSQPEEQATTLEDLLLQCVARSLSILSDSTDLAKKVGNFDTVKHTAVVLAILLVANLIPASLFAVCLAAVVCNSVSQVKDESILMAQLIDACNLVLILLTVHCIPTVSLLVVMPLFAQTMFQKIKEQQQGGSTAAAPSSANDEHQSDMNNIPRGYSPYQPPWWSNLSQFHTTSYNNRMSTKCPYCGHTESDCRC